jgi:pilus assembly protein Flp/PilA
VPALGSPGRFEERRWLSHMTSMYLAIMNFLDRDEDGQGLAEYALILALIAIVAIVALILLGGQVSDICSDARNCG